VCVSQNTKRMNQFCLDNKLCSEGFVCISNDTCICDPFFLNEGKNCNVASDGIIMILTGVMVVSMCLSICLLYLAIRKNYHVAWVGMVLGLLHLMRFMIILQVNATDTTFAIKKIIFNVEFSFFLLRVASVHIYDFYCKEKFNDKTGEILMTFLTGILMIVVLCIEDIQAKIIFLFLIAICEIVEAWRDSILQTEENRSKIFNFLWMRILSQISLFIFCIGIYLDSLTNHTFAYGVLMVILFDVYQIWMIYIYTIMTIRHEEA